MTADLGARPTVDEWRTLCTYAPSAARRWHRKLLWCDDCQEWHAPAARGMGLSPNDGSRS